jgi:hypothetical protein
MVRVDEKGQTFERARAAMDKTGAASRFKAEDEFVK